VQTINKTEGVSVPLVEQNAAIALDLADHVSPRNRPRGRGRPALTSRKTTPSGARTRVLEINGYFHPAGRLACHRHRTRASRSPW
jgi:hypothetical protein